ncbi:MAG: UDP-N-acetylglucosamine 1-carboxyvinyltransferase [Acidibacillus sp.]|uniref:UDP-N-acetylglucosamine 1-carboxyvinyltransferase n=1 Tax=Sulfoacidibacillus ferrooxidans TaxID=2005001 RepID=A0A9X1V5Y1_9BACL|nr:UDP-N-acetylglucosamine 1-carboxyvinyltransferase [Sulfoacidibacillus ferrooxidans]MCI0181770.1 UDP-N-acetylglucosamine 1-carboxyvinyltransferase [Sulfoacidibacillus ferrooxidans]MCY0892931.1 UDP-N-acetylglucosamine 1-carboxyvinyltransferase [Acidibacillus sp.]
MERLVIEGGNRLTGSVRVHGSKNAALPILAAVVMAKEETIIHDVPNLDDIAVMLDILRSLGARVTRNKSDVIVDSSTIHTTNVPDYLMRLMRSSIFLMGPLLARFGSVRISKPGGCSIGTRPIDLHLKGLELLGANIVERHGFIECQASQLQGASIFLDFPSVGATENLMMAAVLAKGETIIGNAAREPEIRDLAALLTQLGARIRGAGEDTIVIEGVNELHGGEYQVSPDRIVAGTLMIAASITGGHVQLRNVRPMDLTAVTTKLREAGVQVTGLHDILDIKRTGPLHAVERIQTSPYPGFPTDLQAPFMSLLTMAQGVSVISETIFEDRFQHVSELQRMGASIKVDIRTAFIRGVTELTGAIVEATDLRAGAALAIAGLAAEGSTILERVHHIDRGYEGFELQLRELGAHIRRVRETGKDASVSADA